MVSSKTIKVNENTKITFKFYSHIFTFETDTIHMTRDHTNFNTTLLELKNDFNLSNYQCKQIRYWYNKNYTKLYPSIEYTNKYGRIIKLNRIS